MNKQIAAVAVFCAVAACGSSTRTVVTPDGRTSLRIKCKGGDNEDCLSTAGEACPRGYSIVDQESHSGGMLADIVAGPVRWHSMLIQCR